ncbi:MAG TPA: CpsB/CapC family capsule biosynthesis tyrosine phosphatase [Bryobacteraceae bacterium]|nr:CpsB/CapC family capsule biosynthesis tyrosine phosphatase [Bryobacteraceae bacterium]
MIDIHAHILPGMDDGPQTLEESLAMLEMAEASGTTDIVATPHANLEYTFDPEAVERKMAELRRAASGRIRIHRGCDFHLTYDNVQDALAAPAKYTVNGKKFLLVELSELLIAKSTDEIFARMQGVGITPVITHPERNVLLHQRLAQIERWVAGGCLVQITAQSLLGKFGKAARDYSEELLRRGLVHFVASDAHDARRRPPRLDQAFELVARKFGPRRAERLFVLNPGAVIAGVPLELDQPEEFRPRKWYQFWR